MSRYSDKCKVYVGDLATNVQRSELEDIFSPYGYLRSVWVAKNPPGFAFVEFDDPRDAKDAVIELDGKRIAGKSVKVEISKGNRRSGGGGGRFGGGGGFRRRGGFGGGGGSRFEETCYACHGKGHYARDCKYGRKPGDGTGRSRRRSYSRSRSRSPRRSRSRSRSPRRRFSRSKSRSPSPKD